MQRRSRTAINGSGHLQEAVWLSPSNSSQWPGKVSVSLPGMDIFPTWVDIFNFLITLAMGPYVRGKPLFKEPERQIYSNASQMVNVTESSHTSGPIAMYTVDECAIEDCGDHKSSCSSDESPDASFVYRSKGDAAIYPGEALSWPSFRYLLFCDKSIIWARFLNDLPVDSGNYRSTRSLPTMKSENCAEAKESRARKRMRRTQNRSSIDLHDSFLQGELSYTKFTYNVDALVVDSPSIFESRNAYRRASFRRSTDSFRRSMDSFASVLLAEKPEILPDSKKARRWTTFIAIAFLYSLVVLVVCRLGFLLAVVVYNNPSVFNLTLNQILS